MGWNGSGAYVRLYNWVDDRDASIPITASRMDGEMDDMAAGIQACVAKNGENAATANLPMGGFRHTGVGNASARNHYAAAAQIQDNALAYAADSGAADAYVIALSPAITAYATGMRIIVKIGAGNTNTTPTPTINVNGVGAKTIIWPSGAALAAGDLVAGRFYEIVYNGTSFELQGSGGTIAALTIDQDNNAVGLNIDSEATTADVINISPATLTTGNVIDVPDADALTTGSILNLVSNSASTAQRNLVFIHNDHTDSIGAIPLYVQQDASRYCAVLDQNADDVTLSIDTESTTANVIQVFANTVTSGIVFNASNANALTTGRIINAESDSPDSSARSLVNISNVNSSATGAIPLSVRQEAGNDSISIDQNGNGRAIYIDSEATSTSAIKISSPATESGFVLDIRDADALTSGRIISLGSNSADPSARILAYIENTNASATGATPLSIRQDAANKSFSIDQNADAESILIDAESTTANVVSVLADAVTSGVVLSVENADALTTGSIARFHSNSSSSSTRNIVEIISINSSATGATPLYVEQDAALQCMIIDQNSISAGCSFIDFRGSAANNTTYPISLNATSGATTHHIQIEINGTKAWIAASTNNPS